jgi:ParB family chromosome partitioning protein
MTTKPLDRQYLEIPVASIVPDPDQPRKDINPETLDELAASIQAMGVEQPINVRIHPNNPDMYMIISGERRWRAAKQAGLIAIPAMLREEMEAADLKRRQLAENYHRDNFNPVEEAEFLNRWVNTLLGQNVESPQAVIAKELGISKVSVSKKLAVLKYSSEVRAIVRDGLLRDKDALSVLNKLKLDDRNLVIKQVKAGDFDFKDFKKNERKILKELRLKDPKLSEKKEKPTSSTSPKTPVKKTKPPILARWSLSRQCIVSLMHNSEYMVLLQEHDLETISDDTLLEIFEKFKLWLEEHK